MLATACLLPLALPPTTVKSHALVFAPEAGAVVERSLSSSTVMTGGDLEVWVGGEQIPPGFLPAIELEAADRLVLSTVDHYRAVEAGAPRSLLRQIVRAEHEGNGSIAGDGVDDDAWEYDASSTLTDEHLLF